MSPKTTRRAPAASRTRKAARPARRTGHGTYEDLLAAYPAEVRAIADRVRALWRSALPDAKETAYLGWRTVFYDAPMKYGGFGPLADRVNVYFPRGAALADPDAILEGTGKGMRHVKLTSTAAAPLRRLRAMIGRATAAAGRGG